jgi:hypothetical protein
MKNSDWWSRKLGNTQPTQRQEVVTQPFGYTRTPNPPQQFQPVVEEGGKIHASDAMIMWQGKDGMRELQSLGGCPDCGSPRYSARSSGVVRGPKPMPQCFDCGYPLVQAGSGMGSLSGSQPVGAKLAKNIGSEMPAALNNKIIGRIA